VVLKRKVLFIFGTRPEAIKLCPVVRWLRNKPDEFDTSVCVTAQHRHMLDQVLGIFDVNPQYDLNVMRPNQTLTESTGRMLMQLEPVLQQVRPDMALVQGDTATTLCGALAAFYANVPVGHVEAGLRTRDLRQPFPEEMNRVVVSRLTALHFAPTAGAAVNLRNEGVTDGIVVTGNPGIDAVLYTRDKLLSGAVRGRDWSGLDTSRKLIVVTAHRRESFGAGFDRIATAIHQIANMDGVQIVYPVHPNPNVTDVVRPKLEGHPNIRLIEPLDYASFVDLMQRAYLLLTDSGGVQEEAPSLGKPVLVLRAKTERPEAVDAGTVTLVGTDVDTIVSTTERLLRDAGEYERRCRIHNPYGDGHASERIAASIIGFFCNTIASDPAFTGTA
jgi:UDP-N-acetylglucosamine 2-epimerase (non-hydrolysing)